MDQLALLDLEEREDAKDPLALLALEVSTV